MTKISLRTASLCFYHLMVVRSAQTKIGKLSKSICSPQPASPFSFLKFFGPSSLKSLGPNAPLFSCLTYHSPYLVSIDGGQPRGRSSHAHYLIFTVPHISILRRKQKPRECGGKAQGHADRKWPGWNWNPGLLPLGPEVWLPLPSESPLVIFRFLCGHSAHFCHFVPGSRDCLFLMMFWALRFPFSSQPPFPPVSPCPYTSMNILPPHYLRFPTVPQASLFPQPAKHTRSTSVTSGLMPSRFLNPVILALQIPSSKFSALTIFKYFLLCIHTWSAAEHHGGKNHVILPVGRSRLASVGASLLPHGRFLDPASSVLLATSLFHSSFKLPS